LNNTASYHITAAREKDFPGIIDVWERSVRATHHFLPEDYLQEIKTLLPSILPVVPVYHVLSGGNTILGFTGVANRKIEMLFIDPCSRGYGIGAALTEYAIRELGARFVDVNEQNVQAIGFYKKIGFVTIGREELDSMGRPYPLLQMKLADKID
jgi:putative acetyltransferase